MSLPSDCADAAGCTRPGPVWSAAACASVSNVDESGLPLWLDAEQPVLGVCVLNLA